MDADSMDEIKEDIESADDFADVLYYEIYSEDGRYTIPMEYYHI